MTASPFAALPHSPRQHFALYFHAAVLRVLDLVRAHFDSAEAAQEKFPFLSGYYEEMSGLGLTAASFDEAHAWWRRATTTWEQDAPIRLPLASLASAAALSYDDLVLLAEAG